MFYIAFKMLTGDKGKFIGIVMGIAFATLIMTQQPGVFVGIMTRTYSFITDIGLPDIWVMDAGVKYVDDTRGMPGSALYRVASVPGVEWAKPLFKGNIQARFKDGNFQSCNVIGIDDSTMIGGPPIMLEGRVEDLRLTDAVIINEEGALDKLAFSDGPGQPKRPMRIGDVFELNDHRSVVVGIAQTTRTFQSQPVIYCTIGRAYQITPPVRDMLSFVLVKVKKGESIQKVIETIKARTGYGAYTEEGFKQLTMDYYLKNTGIPINFGTSVLLGFLVGAAIAGQTFYNFTLDNLKYFGVLKAMGVKNNKLLHMILFQSLIVASLGYGIGLSGTALFSYLSIGTPIAFRFTWQLMVFSIVGVIVISAIAALLSIRKVIQLEPAIVFKS